MTFNENWRKDEILEDIKLLRKAGCKCEYPLVSYRPPKDYPRCRLCNTEVKMNKDRDEFLLKVLMGFGIAQVLGLGVPLIIFIIYKVFW